LHAHRKDISGTIKCLKALETQLKCSATVASNKNILLLMTGSIACYKACQVISNLKKQGHNLKVVLDVPQLLYQLFHFHLFYMKLCIYLVIHQLELHVT
jgi:hypothetical protein